MNNIRTFDARLGMIMLLIGVTLSACSSQILLADFTRVGSETPSGTRLDTLRECKTHVTITGEYPAVPQPHATVTYAIDIEMNACETNPEADFAVDSAFVTAQGDYFSTTRRLIADTAWTLSLRGGPNLAIDGHVLAIPTFRQVSFKPVELPWMVDTLRVVYFVAPNSSLHKVEGRQEVTLERFMH